MRQADPIFNDSRSTWRSPFQHNERRISHPSDEVLYYVLLVCNT